MEDFDHPIYGGCSLRVCSKIFFTLKWCPLGILSFKTQHQCLCRQHKYRCLQDLDIVPITDDLVCLFFVPNAPVLFHQGPLLPQNAYRPAMNPCQPSISLYQSSVLPSNLPRTTHPRDLTSRTGKPFISSFNDQRRNDNSDTHLFKALTKIGFGPNRQ